MAGATALPPAGKVRYWFFRNKGKPERERLLNWLLLSRLPLTTILPVAVSAAILVVTLSVSTIGIVLLQSYVGQTLEQKASIFLDGFAGHVAQAFGDEPERMQTLLANALRHQSTLGEIHVAIGWIDDGALLVDIYPSTDDAVEARAALSAALASGPGTSRFLFSDGQYARLTKVYVEEGSAFAISTLFDARDVVRANRATTLLAMLVSGVMTAVAVAITFLITRRFTLSLRAFSARLANNPALPSGSRNELTALELALATRERSEAERAEALTRLAEVERDALLGRVAATIAHEVRNPLAGILSALSTIRRFGNDRQVREETLEIVEGGLRSLERIADVTLATYRRRGGVKRLTASDIRDLGLLIGPDAQRKQLTIDWRLDETVAFEADADAVRQILVNVLLNACAASPEQGRITVELAATDATVEIGISDQGPGLPDSVLAYLRATNSSQAHSSRELGIGVVTALVEDIGARLSVESRARQGTTITLILQKQPTSTPQRGETA